MINEIEYDTGPVVHPKVTIGDLKEVSSPDQFLERAQAYLRWAQQVSKNAIKKIERIARQNFRGVRGYRRIHRFFKNLLEQFEDGVRSARKAIGTARKEVLTKKRKTKYRRAIFRRPVHAHSF